MDSLSLTGAAVCAFAFIMGSIPFGIVFTMGKGIDLRKVGSCNIGTTNVLRAAGRGAAAMTLLGDTLKGTAAVALGKFAGLPPVWLGAAAVCAVLGHDFSIFLRGKGGKGVATSLGVLLIYTPKAGILTIILWLLATMVTRISSLGALVSFVLLPPVVYFSGYGMVETGAATVLTALLFYKHTENIKRILSGTERRIGDKKT